MATKFHPEEVLKHSRVYTVSMTLAELALESAVLGDLDTARDLVGLLNKYNPCYHLHSRTLKPLWFAWDLTSWPSGEKDRLEKPLSKVKDEYANDPERKYDTNSLAKLKEKLEALKTKPYSDEDQSRVLAAMLEATTVVDENSSEQKGVLDEISKRMHGKEQLLSLAQKPPLWPLLKGGALAKAAGVDLKKQKEMRELAVKTFTERFENGPRNDFEGKSIKELLDIISDNTVNGEGPSAYRDELELEDRPRTLLRNPLPGSDIRALEVRLKVTLPEDYKEYLSITNGFGDSWNGYYEGPALFPAADHRWLTDEEDYFTGLYSDLINIEGTGIVKVLDHEPWPKVGRTIQIGSKDIDEVWLLPPDSVKQMKEHMAGIVENADEGVKTSIQSSIKDFAGSMEGLEKLDWCVMTWASGSSASMNTFPNFKAFLEAKAEASGRNQEVSRKRRRT